MDEKGERFWSCRYFWDDKSCPHRNDEYLELVKESLGQKAITINPSPFYYKKADEVCSQCTFYIRK
jgi:hypothetical protein